MRTSVICGWLALVAAVLLAACGVEKRPGLIEYVQAQTAPGIDLKLMTFNIRYGTADDGPDKWEFRRDFLVEVVSGGDYDVIGMQEVLADQLEFIKARMPGYASVGVGRDDGVSKGEFSPILFRTSRFTLAQSGTFWLSESPEAVGSKAWGAKIPRICSWAKLVEKSSGRQVCIFNMHWDHQAAYARERSAELLTARVREIAGENALVVMGDLNTGEGSSPVGYIKGHYPRATSDSSEAELNREVSAPLALVDTFRIAHADGTEVGTFHAFTGKVDGDKIDYIFVPPGSAVNAAEIIRVARAGHYPSDHFPVVASVRVRVGKD